MLQYIFLVVIIGMVALILHSRWSESRDRGYHSESERIHHMAGSYAKQVENVEKERARQNVRHEGGYYPS